jgi:hypothetical protein
MSEISKAKEGGKKSKEKSSAEREKILIKYLSRKSQRNTLTENDVKGLEPFFEGLFKLAYLGQLILTSREKAAEFISIVENKTASLRDFYELEPVSGLTLLSVITLSNEKIQKKAEQLLAEDKSNRGKRGAAARHKSNNQNAEKLRAIWAEGKYESRTRCAEQECEHLGMSLETARKHLRGTLDPPLWPAKRKPKTKQKR